jgi:hypothetical protein
MSALRGVPEIGGRPLRQQFSEGSSITINEGGIVSRSSGGRGAIYQALERLREIVVNVQGSDLRRLHLERGNGRLIYRNAKGVL